MFFLKTTHLHTNKILSKNPSVHKQSCHIASHCFAQCTLGESSMKSSKTGGTSQEGEVFHLTEHLPYFSFNTKTTASKKKKIYEL